MKLWLLTVDLLTCQGVELCSFHALSFCIAFYCGINCMKLSLLMKVWVFLKLRSNAFFTTLTARCFFLLIGLFILSSYLFPVPKIARVHLGLQAL